MLYSTISINLPNLHFFSAAGRKGKRPHQKMDSLKQDKGYQNPRLDAVTIQRQQERILNSPEFHATNQQRKFLQWVVSETIAERKDVIKGYTIATTVFGRSAEFDQASDPIVSIQANLLRRALERYYLVAGQNDPMRIDIPKGSYVPTFREQIGSEPYETALGRRITEVRFEASWPLLLICQFQNLTGDPEQNYLGIGLTTDLAVELSRFQDIRVLMDSEKGRVRKSASSSARFRIEGNIRQESQSVKISVQLVDTKTCTQIWGDTHHCDKAAQSFAFEEEFARVTAAKIVGEQGIVSKALSIENRSKLPSDLNAYEAILCYYEFERAYTPESFLRALEALEHAAKIEPECGQVMSMLGRLYGDIYCLEFPGFETALDKAVRYAENGVRLNPENQRGRAILGYIHMINNELPAALAEITRALALSPNSLIVLDSIGYILTLLGEWESGPLLIRKAIQLNPYYASHVHYALWVNWIRQENYEHAHLETMSFNKPSVFWEPLIKAATFGQLGRVEEGKRAVENLLKLKPEFPDRGRVLIKHYIKFEDIVENMIEGLKKVGLYIE